MLFDDGWKAKRKIKKEENKVVKSEQLAETLSQTSDTQSDLVKRGVKARDKVATEEWYSKKLDEHQLNQEIREARQNLFIQRDKLIKRMVNFNNEHMYIESEKKNNSIKTRELKRCETGSKNAAYALAVVEDAIDRLDDITSEREWHDIMHDLTKGYKTINALSVGSDLMTRLSFWLQKAKLDINGDISLHAMEHYYGKSIDDLLEQADIKEVAANMLVKDEAMELKNSDKILEAIRWGEIFNVPVKAVNDAVEEFSEKAEKSGSKPIIENPRETYNNTSDGESALDSFTSMDRMDK